MKVLFLPDYRAHNPYQQILADNLATHGVTVCTNRWPNRSPLLQVLWAQLQGEIDVLHLHWTSPFLLATQRPYSLLKGSVFFTFVLLFKILGGNIVWTVHDLVDHEEKDTPLECFFNRLLCHLYGQLIVHCSAARKLVLQTYRLPAKLDGKLNVVPHGHFIDHYVTHVSAAEAKQKLGLEAEDICFLYFGQIRAYKGVLTLVETFKRFSVPQARLLIVGKPIDKTMHTTLEVACAGDKRIQTRLTFIPEAEVQLYLKGADVVVLPFQKILTSSTVILAMSLGKAIIAPQRGCVAAVLDEQGAFLYHPQQANGLEQALQKVPSANLKAMGAYNYQRVQALDWGRIATQTVEVYKKCKG